MRVTVIYLTFAATIFVLVSVVKGESSAEELQPDLEPQAHTLFEKENPIDPEAHGVYTLFDGEEELGREATNSVLKTRRSLYKILRQKQKSQALLKPRSASRRRSLYNIVRKKSRKPAPLPQAPLPPAPEPVVIPPPAPRESDKGDRLGNEGFVEEPEVEEQEAKSETDTEKKVETESETVTERNDSETDTLKDSSPIDRKSTLGNTLDGGRYRRGRL
ncbi:protein TonB-like [Bolinopsis microptera]|uniref:protein TonB-like n=1 Tax=Bolinopsis microptera TaxID=2820187 RepID=UPI003079B89B